MFRHILMPTDGSAHSERAVQRAVELAKLCGAKITGIHVLPDHRLVSASDEWMGTFDEAVEREARERASSFLAYVQETADAAGVACDTVVATNNHPYDAIVDTANQRGCDLIVMTARNRKGLASVIMGNEATRVLHRSSIPVLTFRGLMSADHPDKSKKRETVRA